MNYAICYLYNVYGDGENSEGEYKTVIANFLRIKKEGKVAEINGTGTQLRNFTHVNDVVLGLQLLLNSGHGDGYSFGAKEEYSLIQVAKFLQLEYILVDAKRGDRFKSKIDVKKSEEEIGWKQTHFLTDYLRHHLSEL